MVTRVFSMILPGPIAIGSRVTPIFVESHRGKQRAEKIRETRYETIIPHLAWLGSRKKFPYNPVSIIFAMYSTRMEWIGLVVAVESNDKRPNILLGEEDTCSFFPLTFSFLFVPTSVYFFPSLFFFLFSVEGKERARDGDGTIQFRIKKKRRNVRTIARDGVSSYRFLCHLSLCTSMLSRFPEEVEAGQFTSTTPLSRK